MFPGSVAEVTPDKPAVIMAGTGAQMTYAQLDDEANRLARVLRDAGLEPGGHVAICLENQLHTLAVVWGAHYAGLYYTMVPTRLTPDEMAHILTDSGAEAVVTSLGMGPTPVRAAAAAPRVRLRLMLDGATDGFTSYEEALASVSPAPLPERPEGADFLYSSGTTGVPKGVKAPLPGTELGAPDPATLLCQRLFDVDADTVYLSPAPLYHAAPNRFCRSVHRSGGTVVVMERFEADDFLAAVERYRCTFTQVVPTMFVRILKLPDRLRLRHDLGSLTHVVHAAAPCPVEVKRQIIEWWGPIVHEFYGGTEANGLVYCTSEEWLAHPGTVGRAVMGTIHIVGEDGDEVAVGEVGTVYLEGGGEFAYHNDEEKTLASRDPGGRGWSTLGDVGRVDQDGFLYLTDRQSNMIIVGGVNVYPQEAENLLTTHPAVLDVAVIGVPDDDTGEAVKAVVQTVPWVEGSPQLAAELVAFCRDHLAPVKCPRSVDFRDELPREPTGKLYKRVLREEYWAGSGRTI